MGKIKSYWISLDEETTVNRKIFFLEIVCTLLCGILIGLIFAPYRTFMIASNNENSANNNTASNEDTDKHCKDKKCKKKKGEGKNCEGKKCCKEN
ncbi:MAG: hypothetical protein K6G07_08615 [Lachnospiraceae bacterium]|nr:hypothetical protein [Lachnospiraceae bacterium]